MKKISKISVAGFRGILQKRDLNFEKGASKCNSYVLYGPNSTGKTSFFDSVEWFLSPKNQIEWLQRDKAKEDAYPHHNAQDTFVEITFEDKGSPKKLRKTFKKSTKTKPELSLESGFEEIYDSFVIKPYLRYRDVVEFVLNSTGTEKYKRLAQWMGFEYELSFQKKLAEIRPVLDKFLYDNKIEVKKIDAQILESSDNTVSESSDATVLVYAQKKIQAHQKMAHISPQTFDELISVIPDLKKLQVHSDLIENTAKLNGVKIQLSGNPFSDNLVGDLGVLKDRLKSFKELANVSDSINKLALFEKAKELLFQSADANIPCPVCDTGWKRDVLLDHIKKELKKLGEIDIKRKSLSEEIKRIKKEIRNELEVLRVFFAEVAKAQEITTVSSAVIITEYQTLLETSSEELNSEKIIESAGVAVPSQEVYKKVQSERDAVTVEIQKGIDKMKPSDEEEKMSVAISNIIEVCSLREKQRNLENKFSVCAEEIDKYKLLSEGLNSDIQSGVKERFDDVSGLIGEYFAQLRPDKDIRDIKITYNDTGKAEGRSSEIELQYYDIEVKPAYKILSESLLSSLGISVYLACVKKYNLETKYIILDDVINSLDANNRPGLIKLLKNEFEKHQIIIFTHDRLWFDQLKTLCPSWIAEKIVDWDHSTGPFIRPSFSTKDEMKSALGDDTNAPETGRTFGVHAEGILNKFAENIGASTRHRYSTDIPPSLSELFDSVKSRLKKLKKNKYIHQNQPILGIIEGVSKKSTFVRNVCSHDRRNYSGFITAVEVGGIIDDWYQYIESQIICEECHEMVYYDERSGIVACRKRCLNLSIDKVT